jgi:single-strand selective monofunctional uracil DNA glycosylase
MKKPALIAISRELCAAVDELRFAAPTAYVYNPLAYARAAHESYLTRYGAGTGRILLLGMNPGPFGMAQTGVPFGDVAMVRDFLEIQTPVGRPSREHPSRPVLGFACPRSEVSGTRLWGWARDRYGKASAFFERFFVVNYCPLVFMEASGKNLTPDKLPPSEHEPLVAACDQALARMTKLLEPARVIGIGGYAQNAARRALKLEKGAVGCILHPSPANPKANSGWSKIIEGQLRDLGVKL